MQPTRLALIQTHWPGNRSALIVTYQSPLLQQRRPEVYQRLL